jgi:deoxyribodipyrimidine photo-lyase
MSRRGTAIVWFRQDLRLADNPALNAALASGAAILPVFIWSPQEEGGWAPGAASRWWLHRSLAELGAKLAERGSPLVLRQGPALAALQALAAESGATAVYWNRRYEPAAVAVENGLRTALPTAGIAAHSFASALLIEPWALQTKTGGPYQVYTPYWRAFLAQVTVGAPTGSPASIPAPARQPASLPLEQLALLPEIPWHATLADHWQPGETAARERLLAFSRGAVAGYATDRDRPDLAGTSRLSPHLHFGELSPRQVWTQVGSARERAGDARDTWTQGKYIAELIWREYAAHVLHHVPTLPDLPKQPAFDRMLWRHDAKDFKAWCRGRTGITLVDAGMRELWQTGWMHNRVRMVAASLLVKNLLHRWQDGERWFWDTLVDADLASNALNWQWVAGTGPDAAPFFRIFNADTQAEKFDPEGAYVRRWVPEAGTSAYPKPIVDLKASRQRALDAYQGLRAAR